MSALPAVATIGTWLTSLLDLRRSDLEHRVAASNLVLAYARAYARAEGLSEDRAVAVAFEALRGPGGETEDEAVQSLEACGVDVWRAVDAEADRAREASRDEEYGRDAPWGVEP